MIAVNAILLLTACFRLFKVSQKLLHFMTKVVLMDYIMYGMEIKIVGAQV
jgi:hypothetical protein